jgi:hypothetical protein
MTYLIDCCPNGVADTFKFTTFILNQKNRIYRSFYWLTFNHIYLNAFVYLKLKQLAKNTEQKDALKTEPITNFISSSP